MDKVNNQQNHSISISGGEQKLNYLVSGSYYKRDGVLRFGPDDNSRYNLKINLNSEISKYLSAKITASYIGSFTNENSFGTDEIINRLYRSRARQNLYTPSEDVTGQPYNGDLQINPVDIEKNAGIERRNYKENSEYSEKSKNTKWAVVKLDEHTNVASYLDKETDTLHHYLR